jgi:hypothetical protein
MDVFNRWEASIPPDLLEKGSKFVHSSKLAGGPLEFKALEKIAELPKRLPGSNEERCERAFELTILMMMRSTAEFKEQGAFGIDSAVNMEIGNRSAGSQPTDHRFGVAFGSKEDMRVVLLNTLSNPDSRIALLAATASGKPETLPEEKKERYIFAQALRDFAVMKHYFQHIVEKRTDHVHGMVTGLSHLDGKAATIVDGMYLDELKFNPTLRYEEFISKETQFCEDDKNSFEYTIFFEEHIAVQCYLLSKSKVAVSDIDIVAAAFAQCADPFIQVAGRKCVRATGMMSSGTYYTSCGGTIIHMACTDLTAWKTADKYSLQELSRLTGGRFLGDDRIRLSITEARDMAFLADLDRINLMKSTARVATFADADDITPKGFEFLRKQYVNIGGYLYVTRDFIRVLGKIIKGMHRYKDAAAAAMAVMSAITDIGVNHKAIEYLADLYEQLTALIPDTEEIDLGTLVKRGAGIGFTGMKVPTVQERELMQFGGNSQFRLQTAYYNSLVRGTIDENTMSRVIG